MAQTPPQLDHLVVAAATLAQGVQWCQDVLGIDPGPGGEHPLMGTHNRLARLTSESFAPCYLEIIAIAPKLPPQKPRHQARWFNLDSPALQTQLHTQGPRLLHWVARVPHLTTALAHCAAHGVHPGAPHHASRVTPQGVLEWDISIAPNGLPHAQGMWPTLIAWGEHHPTDTMPPSGLELVGLQVHHPNAAGLNRLWHALGGPHDCFSQGPVQLSATLVTPRGTITLDASD